MIYCAKCGVELEAGMATCPICRQPVSGKDSDQKKIKTRILPTRHEKVSWNRIKQFLTDRIPPFKRIFHA